MANRKLDNTPNARKLLDSLRYLGYDNLYAISDLVDNAIDAEAPHVWVSIARTATDFTICVADDGVGMAEDTLDQAARLGSEVPRDPATDLGRFGMGLVTASLSLGRRLTIVTKTTGGELLSNVTDVDHMMSANTFVKEHFGLVRLPERALYEEMLGDSPSGTVVQITKADGFKRRYVGAFEKQLAQHLGQVYRMFIRSGRQFYVNGGDPIPIWDPLWLGMDDSDDAGDVQKDGRKRAEVYSNETYDIKYTDSQGRTIQDLVRVRLAILPDHGNLGLNKDAGYRLDRAGFYVLRNNREIAEAQLLDLKDLARHPDFIRFRGEIFVTGRLDDAMGIEFTKRDVKPIQSIRDQLDAAIGGNLRSIRQRLRRKVIAGEAETLDHTPSERLINSRSGLLIKPPPQRQAMPPRPTEPGRLADGVTKNDDDGSVTPLGVVQFRNASFGREGPIFATEQKGKTTIVDWNTDHPFYERFVIANRGDRDILSGVDALVFSMAAAELKVFDEGHRNLIESWKSIVSANLRTLLS